MAKSTKDAGVVLDQLKKTVAEGNYYEAQQLIKTLYFRYRTQNKPAEAREILINGASTMLGAKQTTCASELAQMLVKLFIEDHVKVDSSSIETVSKMANLFPPGDPGKISFLKAALKWSGVEGSHKEGEPNLHTLLARAYDEAGEYGYAQKHYLKSHSANEFGKMLIAWASEGYPTERDLYIARAVFMYLSLSNLRDANVVYQVFVQSLQPNQITPLINYLRFLLLTLERDAYPLFDVLRKKYKPSLSRDPSFLQYLDHIAQVFYKVKPAATSAPAFGNFISDLFKNLLPSSSSDDAQIDAEDAD